MLAAWVSPWTVLTKAEISLWVEREIESPVLEMIFLNNKAGRILQLICETGMESQQEPGQQGTWSSQAWCPRPITIALGKLGQDQEFKSSLSYEVRPWAREKRRKREGRERKEGKKGKRGKGKEMHF